MDRLQKTQLANAIFSALSGITMLIGADQLSGLVDLKGPEVFQIAGVGLLIFSVYVLFVIKKKSLAGSVSIVFQDLLWVVGSVLVLIFQPFEINKTGNQLISIVACIVLIIAVAQTNAMAQEGTNSSTKIRRMSYEHLVNAPKSIVWTVVSDVANYEKVAEGLDEVELLSGEGEGMIRRCGHAKGSWTETCSLWDDGQAYTFVVNTEAADYPYPFIKNFQGTWEVEEAGEDKTKIRLTFEIEYKRRIQHWLLHPMVRGKFSKNIRKLMDNYETQIASSKPKYLMVEADE